MNDALNAARSASKAEHLPILENWLQQEDGEPSAILEFPLYTDVQIAGEQRCGPYAFLNPVVPRMRAGTVQAAVVLRYVEARKGRPPRHPLKSDSSLYHGGSLVDEVAALSSLLLGARFSAGGLSRAYGGGLTNDPLGKPVAWQDVPIPAVEFAGGYPIVPSALGSRSLTLLSEMLRLRHLSSKQCVALVRAAKLYQDALWLCEREPQLSWVMLVSALEGAANCWQSDKGAAVDRLCESRPEFVAYLKGLGGDELVGSVAKEFSDSIGATKKFVDFCLAHLPGAPPDRPSEPFRIEWSALSWRKGLRRIYGHRSKALHEGIPFPGPMCEPPFRYGDDPAPTERGTVGLAAHSHGGSWKAEELPTNLNVFAAFTRSVLVNWLKGITDFAMATSSELVLKDEGAVIAEIREQAEIRMGLVRRVVCALRLIASAKTM